MTAGNDRGAPPDPDGPPAEQLHGLLVELGRLIHDDPDAAAAESGRALGDWRRKLADVLQRGAAAGAWSGAVDLDASADLAVAVAQGAQLTPDRAEAVLGQLADLLTSPGPPERADASERWTRRRSTIRDDGQPRRSTMEISLDGWDIGRADQVDWVPWGSRGDARAKILGAADGFTVALVEADPGYRGDPHAHTHPEFLFVVDGTVRTQGEELARGDGYAASPGSTHDDFGTESGAVYLSIFKL